MYACALDPEVEKALPRPKVLAAELCILFSRQHRAGKSFMKLFRRCEGPDFEDKQGEKQSSLYKKNHVQLLYIKGD